MRPVNEERFSQKSLSRHRVAVCSMTTAIRPKSAILAARTVVSHYKKFIGPQRSKQCIIVFAQVELAVFVWFSEIFADSN